MLEFYVWSLLSILVVNGVTINENATQCLKTVVSQFSNDPKNNIYSYPITTSQFPYPCQLLLFSPTEQYGIQLVCPIHGTTLQLSSWTSDLTNMKTRFNPRLIHCVNTNILFIQRYLYCNGGVNNPHYIPSSSKGILDQIPEISKTLGLRFYRRSVYTRKFIVLVYQLISHGMNFQSISEVMANNRMVYFDDNNFEESFHDSVLTSFPSSQKIQDVFLDVFQEVCNVYRNSFLELVPYGCLTADHTFKIGKNIGGYRCEDNKFVKESLQLFLVMDRSHKILSWKLTKTSQQKEVIDLLSDLSTRCNDIDYVIVDNCCESRNMYQRILPQLPVKLDVFHAVQRLTKTLPNKYTSRTRVVANLVGLLFRKKGDVGNYRMQETPEPSEIEANIEHFLNSTAEYFNSIETKSKENFMDSLGRLREHIIKGCLSGIKPGDGTEANEGFHRLLNYSCLRGVSILGPELAAAVLTLLFYSHNSKISGKRHKQNSKIMPLNNIPPIKVFSERNEESELLAESNDVPTSDTEMKVLIDKIRNAIRFFEKFDSLIKQRKLKSNSFLNCKFLEVHGNQSSLFHRNTLQRNCLSFGLVPKEIPRDGDCLFNAILDQLKSHIDTSPSLKQHTEDVLALNLRDETKSTENILKLRNYFVEELQEYYYQPFLLDHADISNYRNLSVFASDTGDFVVHALFNIIGVPILVISSSKDFQCRPFFPDKVYCDEPLFIVYNSLEIHYDSTQEFVGKYVNNQLCLCEPRGSKTTCISESVQTTRCPCVRASRLCCQSCRCRHCGNKKINEKIQKGCGCKIGGPKGPEALESCKDNIGKRASRCPCFKASLGCSVFCNYRNCGNPNGIRTSHEKLERSERNEFIPTSYKRKRTAEYLENRNETLSQGSWTSKETVAFHFICEEARNVKEGTSPEELLKMYEKFLFLQSPYARDFQLRSKSLRQIKGKLVHMYSD